ncbi:MAG: hypothetical protein RJB34_1557 [Pseudomonadota bacterium]|jgi:hypothetical protein
MNQTFYPLQTTWTDQAEIACKRLMRTVLLILSLYLLAPVLAQAAPDWLQVGHVSGRALCAGQETGLGDSQALGFHAFSAFMNGDHVVKRLRLQRNSKIAIRLVGHSADLATHVSESVSGLTASITARGRYVHHPGAWGPVGFIEITLNASNTMALNKRSLMVHWPWPMGSQRIALRPVDRCDSDPPLAALPPTPSRCFGAVGSQCGREVVPNINPLAVCADGRCHYNGGSLEHDQCCATAPYGHACGGPETFVSGETKCRASMDKAVARTASGRSWIRDTDFERLNTTGQWDNAAVCAPSGTIVDRRDRGMCCASMGIQGSAPSATERQAAHRNPTVMGYATAGPGQGNPQPQTHVCR